MPLQSSFLCIILSCFLTFTGSAQDASWKPYRYGNISLKYPPTWLPNKESQGPQTRVTITPDSMRRLTMRMIEIYELKVEGDHTFANFKNGFATSLKSQDESTKVLKTEETSIKDHKAIYAEIIRSSLPARVYGINAGASIYVVFLYKSRHVDIPDPKMEKDEMTILNSIVFAP